jgi:signal transduction histidine kinase
MLEVPTKFPRATVEVAESWPSWTGSAKRLQQIVVNLVQNSFTHGRRANLRIKIYGKAKKGGLELTVEDNGPGIPAHLSTTVFQPFFRYSPETQGTGLGLSIVQKMAKSLGGDAWVDRDFTEGARIKVHLPGLIQTEQ